MTDTFFDEIEASELPKDCLWAGHYPAIQWNNKARAWEFPLDSWGGSLIEISYPLTQIDHGDVDLPGFLLESISIAPIAERQIWEYKNEDGRMVRAEAPNMGDGNKWSKRFNILALLKQSGDLEPIVITAGGYTGEQLYNTIRQGRKRLATILRAIDRPNIPAYLFWLELVAGQKQMVGGKDKSAIWPPVVIVPELASLSLDELAGWVTEIYIGHPAKDALRDGLFEAGQQWKIERHAEVQMLASGGNGGPKKVEVNEDGTLHIPDLGAGTKDEWLTATLDVGLFDARDKAHKAFLSVIRKNGLKGPTCPAQWDAWKEEVEHLWDEKLSREQDEALEMELR